MHEATLAQRSYAVLVQVLEETGALEPGHGRKAADRAVAEQFGVSVATARNWRRGRQHHVSAKLGERLIEAVTAVAPQHAERLRMHHDLAHRLDRIDRIAERLTTALGRHMGTGTTWHIYSGPLVLAFAPSLRPAERADLVERATLLIERITGLGFDHHDVPALPELIRSMLHVWHHAGTFGVRAHSVQESLARAGRSYLNRIELALYFGDVCAMSGLFTGDVRAAGRHSARARALLAEASEADEAASPVSRADAESMVAAVRVQTLACHAPASSAAELTSFAAAARCSRAGIDWIESVRCAALGYLAVCIEDDPEMAAEHFFRATECSNGWLRAFGIPFGSTPHRALAACARWRTGATADACLGMVHEALHDAHEHAVVVDEVAAHRAAAAILHATGDELRAAHHEQRALETVRLYGLGPWDRVLCERLTCTS